MTSPAPHTPDDALQTFNLSASNSSALHEAEIPYYIKVTSMTFCILIMCLGVIGNIMVPIVILKTKDMRNSTNIFLVNLSIADLMVLLVCTPTVLVEVNSKPDVWTLGKELCLAVPFVELTVAHASVLTILAISFERYYAICEPLRAGYVCTKTRATLICFLVWFFAAVFTSPVLFMTEHRIIANNRSVHHQCITIVDTLWPSSFFVMIVFFFFILPLFILVVLYSVIAKHLIAAAATVVSFRHDSISNVRARKQVILMLATVVLSFFVCLSPFRILVIWIILSPNAAEKMSSECFLNVLYFCRGMIYVNSAINPILYNLMSSKFRNGFFKFLQCKPIVVEENRLNNTGSTTSSSLSRTTNSLRRIFKRRSIECENNSDSKFEDERTDKHGIAFDVGVNIDKMRPSIRTWRPRSMEIHRSLRRNLLMNSVKARSLDCDVETMTISVGRKCYLESYV